MTGPLLTRRVSDSVRCELMLAIALVPIVALAVLAAVLHWH